MHVMLHAYPVLSLCDGLYVPILKVMNFGKLHLAKTFGGWGLDRIEDGWNPFQGFFIFFFFFMLFLISGDFPLLPVLEIWQKVIEFP